MKKELSLILLIGVLVIIAGCDRNRDNDSEVSGAFVGGDDGLDIKFAEDEPPDRVLDANAEDFFITVELDNKGEDDIEASEVLVTLSGISKDQFQLDTLTKKNANFISGVFKDRNDVIGGGKDEIVFSANYKEDLKQDFEPTITANICYTYETRSLSNLCLRRDAVRRELEGECTIDAEKVIENSGAPIQVKAVKERKAGTNEVTIIFELENVGSGEVFGKGAFASQVCEQDPSKENFVNVKLEPVTDLNIRCSKFGNTDNGAVRLNTEGKATVTCEIATNTLQESAFEEPLNINLDYVYKQRISKAVIVENAI